MNEALPGPKGLVQLLVMSGMGGYSVFCFLVSHMSFLRTMLGKIATVNSATWISSSHCVEQSGYLKTFSKIFFLCHDLSSIIVGRKSLHCP